MKIEAAVLRSYGTPFSIEAVDLAEPGRGEVLVRIAGVGICHSDLGARDGLAGTSLPVVLGHEGAGVVEAIGAGVSHVAVGDHVVLSYGSCGACEGCSRGEPWWCSSFFQMNASGLRSDGSTPMTDELGAAVGAHFFGQSSFATHSIALERNVVVVDKSLPLDVLGPLGCGFLTGAGSVFNALGVRPGSSIAVFGVGAVGLAAIMAAKIVGCIRIVAIDVLPQRLELAAHLGATDLLNGNEEIVTEIQGRFGGLDYSLDTTGVGSVVAAAIDSLRPSGTCGVLAGSPADIFEIPAISLLFGRTVKGIIEGFSLPQALIPQLITLWQQDRFPFDQLVHTYDLASINEAAKATSSGDVVKAVLIPH